MQYDVKAITGRLGRDAIVSYNEQRAPKFVRLSVAANEGEETITYYDAVAFGRKTSLVIDFKKGQMVTLLGFFRKNSWTDKDGNLRENDQFVIIDTI